MTTGLDLRMFKSFDLPSLHKELERREKAIADIKESMGWAMKEHEDQIVQLKAAIEWKNKNG